MSAVTTQLANEQESPSLVDPKTPTIAKTTNSRRERIDEIAEHGTLDANISDIQVESKANRSLDRDDAKLDHKASYNSIELATRRPLPPSTSTIFTKSSITPAETTSQVDDSTVSIHRHESSLAPVDGGFGAWSFLLAAFFVENIVWGFPNAFGVFLDAYLNDPVYSKQKHASLLLPLIGTLTSGIIYCSGPLTYPIMYRYPKYRRPTMWLGVVICWASLFGASYTSKVTTLVLCQGVLYAIGGTMLYNPCISYMSEWFIARRGLANGVINAGTATGGLILPLALPTFIDRYGTSKTLRILAVIFVALLLPVLPFLRGRLPHSRVRRPPSRPNAADNVRVWLRNRNFQFLMIANTLQGLGYFVPLVWLPTFASELDLSTTSSSLTLAILNGASVVGRLAVGVLSDKIDPWILALSTLFGTCMATFILWGVLSHSLAGLLSFGLAYGSLAGGWSSLWTGFIREIAREDPRLSTTLMGYLMFSRGVGNILSTPISTALLRRNASSANMIHEKLGFDVAGGKFEKVIIYTGTCFAGAAIIAMIGWGLDRMKPRVR